MGFQRWRTILRIHHGLVHLANGRSVTDTAVECGWSDPSSCIEAFTEVVGQTPADTKRICATAWGSAPDRTTGAGGVRATPRWRLTGTEGQSGPGRQRPGPDWYLGCRPADQTMLMSLHHM
ncbi:helix-turn-helix domain-containing protein [Micromonospora sp. NPDC049523]|uniref:helix-turn-helix domain-containing protein n=1 Tax=Micromonospora sp. NPDC049523 TaxID=3155921 RepID=UPI0034134A29